MAADTPPAARLEVLENGRDSAKVQIGPRAQPTWLVLGQSHSLGWKATLDGKDLGPATPVNGYANGWLIPAGTGTVKVTLDWTPQTVVWGALIGSAVAVLICIAITVFGLRRRRSAPADQPFPGDQPTAFTPSVMWRSAGAAPSIRATVVATVLAGLMSAAVISPIAGAVVAVATLAALHWRRARPITVLGPAATMALSGLYTMVSQFRHDLPPGFGWPQYFEKVHQVAYVGIALLAVELVVDRLWTGRWWPRSDTDQATEGPR